MLSIRLEAGDFNLAYYIAFRRAHQIPGGSPDAAELVMQGGDRYALEPADAERLDRVLGVLAVTSPVPDPEPAPAGTARSRGRSIPMGGAAGSDTEAVAAPP